MAVIPQKLKIFIRNRFDRLHLLIPLLLIFFGFILVSLLVPVLKFDPKTEQSSAQNTPTANDIPYGLDLMRSPEKIMQLRPQVKTGQVSSHAKNGLNADNTHEPDDGQENYLYKNGSNYVILDEKGSGTITRIWMPFGDNYKNNRLQIFFDGEITPRVNLTLGEFFSGNSSPFLTPLVGNSSVSSGGNYSYVPMSFANSARIEITAPPPYYNIGFEKYDSSMQITTFTTNIDLSEAINKWQNVGSDPKVISGLTTTVNGSIDSASPILPGGSREIFNVSGPTLIKSITFNIPGYSDLNDPTTREFFTKVRIKATWDNNSQPNLDTPLGAFFGTYPGKTATSGLFFGANPATGRFYNFYPMPFASSGKIEIINDTSSEISGISFTIDYTGEVNLDGLGTKIGYFNSVYSKEEPVTSGVDFKIADITGNGQVVAVTIFTNCWSPIPELETFRQCQEGDERFYIDNSNSPSIYGTGTEDYFNGGFYYENGIFSRPSHGHNFEYFKHNSNPGTLDGYAEDSAWRTYPADPIPFRSRIKMGIEHGNPGAFIEFDKKSTWPGNYYSVIFWYGSPNTNLTEIDSLDVGNSASEQSHDYTSQSSTDVPNQSFYYEGDNDDVIVTDNGESGTGLIKFTINVSPEKNHLIRRLLDQSIRNQTATVKVDGIAVGTWFDGGRNSVLRWKESEFFIPASATSGKNYVTVQIEPQNSKTWTGFKYWVNTVSDFAVSITSPKEATQFSGEITTISAKAISNKPIDKVEFYDGTTLLNTVRSQPYSTSWNTSAVAVGNHTLTVKAYDVDGKVRTSAVNVNITPLSVVLSGRVLSNQSFSSVGVTGTAPLSGVDLQADVSGIATGSIRYRFDCTNNGTIERDVTTTLDPFAVADLCSYTAAGSYTARVTVDRDGIVATDTLPVTVTSAVTYTCISSTLVRANFSWIAVASQDTVWVDIRADGVPLPPERTAAITSSQKSLTVTSLPENTSTRFAVLDLVPGPVKTIADITRTSPNCL